MYMLAEINLPHTTTRIKVRDIPALFATAIRFLPPEGSPRQLIGIKKLPLTDANKQAWCGIGPGENTPVFPVCLTEEDHQAAWGDLPPLNFPIDESEWLAYTDSFVRAKITDWGLVPEFQSLEAYRLIAWDEVVCEAVKSGELKPHDEISFLSIPKAKGNELSEAFVHVENLKEFAAKRRFLVKASGGWYETRKINGSTLGETRQGFIDHQTWIIETQAKGRYSIEDAALLIERETGSRAHQLVEKLKQAALAETLPVYQFGDDARYRYGEGFASIVRVWAEECYWDDLNKWLKDNEPRLNFRFPEPVGFNCSSEVVPPISRTAAQDKAILQAVHDLGYDALRLPKHQAGRPGVKKATRERLGPFPNKIFTSDKVFDTAWQRLRGNDRLLEAPSL